MVHNALILLAKAPIPGLVKTRLVPPFTKAGAAKLYSCLLQDTASELARLNRVGLFLFYSPPGSGDLFRGSPFTRFERLPQREGDLGGRMADAFATVFARGCERVVLVGADSPSLSASLARSAFRELSSCAGAVFGPSRDGGFYLVALRGGTPPLFQGVEWGTGTVMADVASRYRAAGIPYALLPSGFDIDTADDVSALARWAKVRSVPACPRTRRWLISRGGRRASAPSPGPRSRSGE